MTLNNELNKLAEKLSKRSDFFIKSTTGNIEFVETTKGKDYLNKIINDIQRKTIPVVNPYFTFSESDILAINSNNNGN